MDSPINEEMIYNNLVGATFSFYEKCVKSKIREFFINYDPRKSINREYLVMFFNKLYGHFSKLMEEL